MVHLESMQNVVEQMKQCIEALVQHIASIVQTPSLKSRANEVR